MAVIDRTAIGGAASPPVVDAVLDDLESIRAALAEKSLHQFVRQMWSIVEPRAFVDNWHIGLICEHLEAVTRGEIQRLLINVPPRHTKSLLVSVFWPAWTWTQRRERDGPLAGPETRFMTASYSHRLSERDARRARHLLDSKTYRDRWGHRFAMHGDQNTKTRYENDQGGSRLATSVGGSLTGEGGDVIVIDDPLNAAESESELIRESCREWWDHAMSTRLNDPQTGAYVLIMQRLHHADLAGHVLSRGDDWAHLCLPARFEQDHPHRSKADRRSLDGELLWPTRFPETEIERLENTLGPYGSAGQLQQRPAPREGGMFDPHWWEIVEAAPAGGRIVRGWDLAMSTTERSPWTVGLRMKRVGDFYYIDDEVRMRGTDLEVERSIQNTAKRDGRTVTIDLPQDPAQAGKWQVRYLVRKLAGYRVVYSQESGDKAVRAAALSSQVQAGNCKLIRGDWNEAFIREAQLFPNTDFTDRIDAASRAFHRLVRRRGSRPEAGPEVITTR